jgi:signal transduction histidine kinase
MGPQTWQRYSLLALTGLFGVLLIGESFLSSGRWINQPFPGFFVHENLTVGPYSVPGWTGAEAGLQSLDRVVSMAGRPLQDRAALYDSVRHAPVGTPIRYQIQHGAEVRDYTVATMTFSFRDWLLSFGIYLIIGLAFLLVGVAPYFYRASSPVALPLCFMVLAVFVWFQTTFDFMTEAMLPKELRIFALALTPSAAIHLALLLKDAGAQTVPRLRVVTFVYGVGVTLGLVNSLTYFGPLEIWIDNFRAGYLYVCVGAASFLWITGQALRRCKSHLERSRLRVMFVGALLGFLLPALMALLTSAYSIQIPYNLALVPTIFFPISVAYALLKYSLFELGNALRVGLSRIGLLTLLVAIYAVIAYVVTPWLGDYAQNPLVPIFFSVLVVILFNPLLRWLESVVDRYIFRQEYDPAALQAEISLYLRTLNPAATLAKGFLERITPPLGIAGAVIVYRAKDASEPLIVAGESASIDNDVSAAANERLAQLWPDADFPGVTRTEAASHPRYQKNRERVLEIFHSWSAELLLPLVYEREVRGAVALGAKPSGHEYSAEDFRLLSLLSDQLALSLENGRLYEQSIEAYRRVENSNRKLLEMDRIKKDFVANICHELRTPLSTIIGFSELLRAWDVSGEQRKWLDGMINNGQELSGLMDNLMNFSRMEADGSSTQFEIVKLKEILRVLELMTQRLIRQRPIQFGIHIESAIDTIESDGQKLQQILAQLLTNALKFTEKGKIDLSIRETAEADAKFLEIAVADTGIGIKREDQDVIFEDFRQLDGSSTRQYGGTGLGLGLCRKLAAALGGEIRLSSEVGVGSVFRLLVPVRAPAPDQSAAAAISAYANAPITATV